MFHVGMHTTQPRSKKGKIKLNNVLTIFHTNELKKQKNKTWKQIFFNIIQHLINYYYETNEIIFPALIALWLSCLFPIRFFLNFTTLLFINCYVFFWKILNNSLRGKSYKLRSVFHLITKCRLIYSTPTPALITFCDIEGS